MKQNRLAGLSCIMFGRKVTEIDQLIHFLNDKEYLHGQREIVRYILTQNISLQNHLLTHHQQQ